MTIPLKFASLYDGQEVLVWSDCLLDLGVIVPVKLNDHRVVLLLFFGCFLFWFFLGGAFLFYSFFGFRF